MSRRPSTSQKPLTPAQIVRRLEPVHGPVKLARDLGSVSKLQSGFGRLDQAAGRRRAASTNLEDSPASPSLPATRPARPRADERVSKQSLDPLSELIYTILSQNTSDANSRPAFEKLVQRFPDWDAARRARTSSIKAAIRRGGLANQKAPRIKNLLEEIHHEHGKLTLDHVKKMSDEEAVAYLTGFHGVGRKTAACVLMFSLGRPVLPVDTHVHRVAKRLGLIPEKATADQAHDLLQKQVRDRQVADFHVLLVRHGRRICKAQRPLCLECPLLSGCPHGQQRLATGEAAPDERYDKGREAADGSVPHVSPAGSRGSRRTR